MLGILPAWAFYIRHATGVRLDNVDTRFAEPDSRPAIVLDDNHNVALHAVRQSTVDGVPAIVRR